MLKEASHCKNGHPRTPENVGKNGRCKPCDREIQRKRYKTYPEKMRERARKYRETHSEEIRERRRHHKHYKVDPEKVRERHRKWREAHPEKQAESYRKYKETNPEKVRESSRKYRKTHLEKYGEWHRKYLTMMNGNFTHFTQQEWGNLLDATGHICLCCRRNEAELKVVGLMLVPDHVIPICDPSDRLKGHRDDISNIQPLCNGNKLGNTGGCNQIKGGKCTDYRTQKSQY